MYIVPPDMVDDYRKKQRIENIEHPEKKVKLDVDERMNDILHDATVSDRDKVVLYSQLLHKLIKHPEQPAAVKPSLPRQNIPQEQSDHWADMTIQHVPSRYKQKAESLFKYLKQDNRVKWNRGGTLKIDGQNFPGTNVMDIVSYTTR